MTCLSFTKIFIFFSVALLFSISNVYSEPPYEFVDIACGKVDKPYLCMDVLTSDSRSIGTSNLTTFTQIAVDFTTKNATNTRDYFRGVKTGPPGVLKSLVDCIDAYNTAISSFQICMKEEECSMTSYDIHSAGDEVKRCQSIADSNGAHDSFITTSNTVTEDLCWLSEQLSNLMCKGWQKF